MELPSIKHLIEAEDDRTVDESRWSLFEWILDGKSIPTFQLIRSSGHSKYIQSVEYTLDILTKVRCFLTKL